MLFISTDGAFGRQTAGRLAAVENRKGSNLTRRAAIYKPELCIITVHSELKY